jgi:phage terminase large subunit-like protein
MRGTPGNSCFRHNQGGRDFDPELVDQQAILPKFVSACGFANAKAAGYEADDFLAAAVANEERAGGTTLAARLATMDATVPLPAIRDQHPHWDRAARLAQDWELDRLARRLGELAAQLWPACGFVCRRPIAMTDCF